MPNSRADSSAPFEVLVAVVIMGFVLVMAAQAFEFLNQKQCEAQIKDQASSLKTAVQDAIRGNSVRLNFFPPTCFQKEEKQMKLEVVTSKARCSAICGRELDECLFFLYDSDSFKFNLCFDNAPTYTTFLDNSSGCQLSGFSPVDFRAPTGNIIPRGLYNIQNRTGGSETVPKLCAFHKDS